MVTVSGFPGELLTTRPGAVALRSETDLTAARSRAAPLSADTASGALCRSCVTFLAVTTTSPSVGAPAAAPAAKPLPPLAVSITEAETPINKDDLVMTQSCLLQY